MYRKVTAGLPMDRINRVLRIKSPKELEIIADFLEAFAPETAPPEPVTTERKEVRAAVHTVVDVAELKLIIHVEPYDFFTPALDRMAKIGIDTGNTIGSPGEEKTPGKSWPDIIIYSEQTKNVLGEIGNRLAIGLDRILLPNRDQTGRMRQDGGWSKLLTGRGIYWLLFLMDPKNPDKNVSLEEWFNAPEQYTAWQRPLTRSDKKVYAIRPDSQISTENRGGVFFTIRAGGARV